MYPRECWGYLQLGWVWVSYYYYYYYLVFAAVTIGFNSQTYSVNECDGQVSITIGVAGSLHREVVVYLSTNNQTAYGDFLLYLVRVQLSFVYLSLQLVSTMKVWSASHWLLTQPTKLSQWMSPSSLILMKLHMRGMKILLWLSLSLEKQYLEYYWNQTALLLMLLSLMAKVSCTCKNLHTMFGHAQDTYHN